MNSKEKQELMKAFAGLLPGIEDEQLFQGELEEFQNIYGESIPNWKKEMRPYVLKLDNEATLQRYDAFVSRSE